MFQFIDYTLDAQNVIYIELSFLDIVHNCSVQNYNEFLIYEFGIGKKIPKTYVSP